MKEVGEEREKEKEREREERQGEETGETGRRERMGGGGKKGDSIRTEYVSRSLLSTVSQ